MALLSILLAWMLHLFRRRFDAAAISIRVAVTFATSMLVTAVFACCRAKARSMVTPSSTTA